MRLYDFNANAGHGGLGRDERPTLKEAPSGPGDRLRGDRSATYTGQIFKTDPRTCLNRILDEKFADGVVFCCLETSLPDEHQAGCLVRDAEDRLVVLAGSEVGGEPEALADWPALLRLQFALTGRDVRGFAREAPAGLGKCLNRRCHLGAIGVTAITFASDGQDLHGLHVVLMFDGALDESQRRPAHGRDERAVGPKRRKAGSQPPELVSQQLRRSSLHRLGHPMDSQLRIDLDQDVDAGRQNLDLKQHPVRYLDNLTNDRLKPPLDAIDRYLAPIFRTKDQVGLRWDLHEKTMFRFDLSAVEE